MVQELVRGLRARASGHPRRGAADPVDRRAREAAHRRYVGHSTPDMAQLGNTWISEFVALKALAPLDPWVAHSPEIKAEVFFPGIWATNLVDWEAYGDPMVRGHAPDLLPQGHPASRRIRSRSRSRGGLDARDARGEGARWVPRAYAIFLPVNEWTQPMILGLQTRLAAARGQWHAGRLLRSEFTRAFDFYVDLFRERLAPPVAEYRDREHSTRSSSAATSPCGSPARGTSASSAAVCPSPMQDEWATAPLPGPSGAASGLSMAGGSSLVIFRSARVTAPQAWELIEFLSRPRAAGCASTHLCGDRCPARREAWQDTDAGRRSQARGVRGPAPERGAVADGPGVGADRHHGCRSSAETRGARAHAERLGAGRARP